VPLDADLVVFQVDNKEREGRLAQSRSDEERRCVCSEKLGAVVIVAGHAELNTVGRHVSQDTVRVYVVVGTVAQPGWEDGDMLERNDRPGPAGSSLREQSAVLRRPAGVVSRLLQVGETHKTNTIHINVRRRLRKHAVEAFWSAIVVPWNVQHGTGQQVEGSFHCPELLRPIRRGSVIDQISQHNDEVGFQVAIQAMNSAENEDISQAGSATSHGSRAIIVDKVCIGQDGKSHFSQTP